MEDLRISQNTHRCTCGVVKRCCGTSFVLNFELRYCSGRHERVKNIFLKLREAYLRNQTENKIQ